MEEAHLDVTFTQTTQRDGRVVRRARGIGAKVHAGKCE
jgi:hypothetical protein